MRNLIWLLKWILRAAIFFTLFAFALNNREPDVTVNFFFGTYWRAPLVLVVLAAFALGLAVGVFGMLPHWWKRRNTPRPLPGMNPPAAARDEPAPLPPTHGI